MSAEYISYPPRPTGGETSNDTRLHVLIFFVPGNPGLIGYYEPFLSALRDLIDSSPSINIPEESGISFHIYGQNLRGFSDNDHEPFTSCRKPYNLEQQIEHTLRGLSSQRIRVPGPEDNYKLFDRVLLIGHSVGSFIALEICHRVLQDPALAPDLNGRLNSGILLFPTIDHIADSPSGQKLNLLRQTPLLGANAYRIAQGFLHLWPYGMLHGFVSRVLGFPPHAADITTRWLKSRDGVWQSLHLGMDEMRLIREDKWSEELWEISEDAKTKAQSSARFYFFFGKNDHWVADHYREEFIKKRSQKISNTRVVVDEGKIPHAFCIEHSENVAKKVHGWINEMYT